MGSITGQNQRQLQQQGQQAIDLALNPPPGWSGPRVNDIVGGVNEALNGRPVRGTPLYPLPAVAGPSAPPVMPTPAPYGTNPMNNPTPPGVGIGDIMRSIQQAQSTTGGGLSNAPGIADIIRQVRALQGI